jgi:hypothetical protein
MRIRADGAIQLALMHGWGLVPTVNGQPATRKLSLWVAAGWLLTNTLVFEVTIETDPA